MRRILLVSFLLVCSLWSTGWAQERKVTGKVTSAEDGNAIPGVSVVLKGSSRGANTDADGNYSIAVPSSGGALVVSFVGTTTQEIAIGNKSTIDVKLVSDSRQLTEVVVTGVGVATDKRKLGISVEAVSAKNLPQTPSASIDQALIGKIAGAQITSSNGTPGADVSILLRGINTINRGTQPMILIDGIQVASTNLNTIDLNTIERVEVVQGAASATIYGAQGANGVIQLFTKRGRSGKINVDISSGVSQNTYLNIGDVHQARFHSLVTDASNNIVDGTGKPLVLDPNTLTFNGGAGKNVTWNSLDPTNQNNKPYNANLKYNDTYATFFQPAQTYNNSVVLTGGSDRSDFLISLSNNTQGSNIRNNGGLSRTNLTTNLGFTIAKGLTFRSTTQLAYTKNTIKADDRTIIYATNNTRPFADYTQKDVDGNYGAYYGPAPGVNGFNPNYYLQYQNTNDNKIDVIQGLELDYKPIRFLDLNAKYGLNYQRQEAVYTYGNQSQNRNAIATQQFISGFNTVNTGEIDNYSFNKVFQNFLATATVNFDFQRDFSLKLPITSATQVAFDYRNRKDREYDTYSLGLPTYTPFTADQATSFKTNFDYTEPFITYGYLVNQRFEYASLIGIAGGFRSDYSSAYGQGSKPFTFPNGNIYFRPSALKFWENGVLANILPEVKLRAAYGEAGIQPKPFDRYVTLGTRTIGNSNSFYAQSKQSNPNLSVEVSRELEVGTDLAFNIAKSSQWLSIARLSATYWKRNTDNAIFDVNAAPSSGTGTYKDNAFSLESNGFQFSLNTTVLKSRDITWNFTANFGKQSSKIKAVKGNQEVVITSSAGSTNYVLKAGEKIGQLYGFLGLHSVTETGPDGNPYIAADQQANYTLASNGWVVNKTTKQPYFTPTQYSFGDPNPKFNMSFINDITFRGFLSLGFQFDWVNGSHLYNQTKEWMYRDGIHGDYDKAITIDGQTGAWTAFYRGVYAQVSRNGTKNYFYEDASFVRLRNVSVGLDFSKLVNLPVLRRAQLVLSGRNLLTFTKYTGYDPEISSGANRGSNRPQNQAGDQNSAFDRGVDHNTMPNYKSYQATLNIGF